MDSTFVSEWGEFRWAFTEAAWVTFVVEVVCFEDTSSRYERSFISGPIARRSEAMGYSAWHQRWQHGDKQDQRPCCCFSSFAGPLTVLVCLCVLVITSSNAVMLFQLTEFLNESVRFHWFISLINVILLGNNCTFRCIKKEVSFIFLVLCEALIATKHVFW